MNFARTLRININYTSLGDLFGPWLRRHRKRASIEVRIHASATFPFLSSAMTWLEGTKRLRTSSGFLSAAPAVLPYVRASFARRLDLTPVPDSGLAGISIDIARFPQTKLRDWCRRIAQTPELVSQPQQVNDMSNRESGFVAVESAWYVSPYSVATTAKRSQGHSMARCR